MIASGFYRVVFSAELPGASGVVVVDGATVRGGDDQYIYAGTLELSGDKLTARMRIKAMTPNTSSVFGTRGGSFDLTLSGSGDENGFSVAGPSPVGGAGITIRGTRIAELDLQ